MSKEKEVVETTEEKVISKEIFKDAEYKELEQNKQDKDRGWKTLKVEGDMFMENLPDTVSKKALKDLENYKSQYLNASLEAASDKAMDFLEENADLKGVSVKMPYGNSALKYVSHNFTRCHQGENNGVPYKTVIIATKVRDTVTSGNLVKDIKDKMNARLLNK